MLDHAEDGGDDQGDRQDEDEQGDGDGDAFAVGVGAADLFEVGEGFRTKESNGRIRWG